jgi:hypothetical protein
LSAWSVKDVDARDKPGHDGLDWIALLKTLKQRQYTDAGGDNAA